MFKHAGNILFGAKSLNGAVVDAQHPLSLDPKQKYTASKPIVVKSHGVVNGNGATVSYSGPNNSALFDMSDSIGAAVSDVVMTGGSWQYAIAADRSTNCFVSKVTVDNGAAGLINLKGCSQLLIDSCHVGIVARNGFYCGTIDNNFTLSNTTFHGSLYEHCVRVHCGVNAVVSGCALYPASPSSKDTLTVHDGDGIQITNVTNWGWSDFGPVRTDDLKHDTQSKQRLTNCRVDGGSFAESWILEAGIDGLVVNNVTLKSTKMGAAFNFYPDYAGRHPARAVVISNTNVTRLDRHVFGGNYGGGSFSGMLNGVPWKV